MVIGDWMTHRPSRWGCSSPSGSRLLLLLASSSEYSAGLVSADDRCWMIIADRCISFIDLIIIGFDYRCWRWCGWVLWFFLVLLRLEYGIGGGARSQEKKKKEGAIALHLSTNRD
jgi:hypothetical protein